MKHLAFLAYSISIRNETNEKKEAFAPAIGHSCTRVLDHPFRIAI